MPCSKITAHVPGLDRKSADDPSKSRLVLLIDFHRQDLTQPTDQDEPLQKRFNRLTERSICDKMLDLVEESGAP